MLQFTRNDIPTTNYTSKERSIHQLYQGLSRILRRVARFNHRYNEDLCRRDSLGTLYLCEYQSHLTKENLCLKDKHVKLKLH